MMTAAIQSSATANGITITLSDGSAMLAMVNACAAIYLWLQWLAVLVLKASRLTTSQGADVDSFAGDDFNCPRIPGTASSGPAVFSRYSVLSAAILAVGTPVKTTDGSQTFNVLADATNAAWQAPSVAYPLGSFLTPAGTASLTVNVQNTQVGSAGNIIQNVIGLIAGTVPFDNVTNPAAFANGLDEETDDAYKARFSLFLPGLAKSIPIAVQSAVLAVAQNLTCAVLNNTTSLGGPFAAGYFVVAVDDGSGATPSATLAAVQAAVDETEALGATGYVVQAPPVDAAVELTITCPTVALKALAVPLVAAAVDAYIAGLAVSTIANPAALPYSRIAQIAYDASPSVTNVTAITLNGGTADIGGTPGTVVRNGGVTVN